RFNRSPQMSFRPILSRWRAVPRSWFYEHLLEKHAELANDRLRNFMSAAEVVPFDGETGFTQGVAEPFCPDIGQDFVLRAVALKHPQALPLRHKWTPDRLCKQVAGELHKPGIGTVSVEHRVARDHGTL